MLCLLLAMEQTPVKPVHWFGPATAAFKVEVPGNPYDPLGNDMRVVFKGPKEEWRLAYYDSGTWKATLVAQQPGNYTASLFRNGVKLNVPTQRVVVRREQKLADGFLRVGPDRRFAFDSGQGYFPIGHNLGWQNPNDMPLVEQIAKMAGVGINWTRIWANHWDGKNPYFPQGDAKIELGRMWTPALEKWDTLVSACEKHGVRMQFVLFHHGLFSDRVNPNWGEHPWNAANGGFLKDPADFFTDTRARNLSRAWLRYAVARWGHSPGIMAWELFNEVEWVKARYDDRWGDIAKWHDEMAAFLRSIDPYKHLVTTSSTMEPADYYKSMDYYQPHTYPPSVWGAIMGQSRPTDKPLFFGEFGPGTYIADQERGVVRDGIWAGVLSGQQGAGQYWYWDRAVPFYDEFARATKVLSDAKFAEMFQSEPLKLTVEGPKGGVLDFSPGSGWGETSRFEFRLPEDASPALLAKLSGYFQSSTSGNKNLRKQPVVFKFNAPTSGTFSVAIGQISRGGGNLQVFVNGSEAARKEWPAGEGDRNVAETVSAPFPAGEVEVRLENDGADWFVIRGFKVDGISPAVSGAAVGDGKTAILRLRAAAGITLPVTVTLNGLGLSDGRASLRETNLDTGAEKKRDVTLKSGVLEFTMVDRDVVLVLSR